jgi:hypothetical protein
MYRRGRNGCAGILRVFDPVLAQLREILPRIVELEGGEPAPVAFSDLEPLGHGTRRRHLHHKTTRRNDNETPDGGFSGVQHAQHGAMEGMGNPPHHICAIKPQHREKGFNDADERFAVALDGQVPVHSVSLCS